MHLSPADRKRGGSPSAGAGAGAGVGAGAANGVKMDDAGVAGDNTQLLFFDTFSHDVGEELNLDLVQFPSPVIVEEVRVIPLGAQVRAS